MTERRFKGKYFVIWPQYLDSTLSHRLGRRVPKHLCVPKPSQRELLEAARSLGREAIPLEDKRYPRQWWNTEGPIAIERKGEESKRQVLMELAKQVYKNRYANK